MTMCADCQAMYDKWRYQVWPAPTGWVHLGNKNLSVMNYKARQQDRSALVRRQLRMIRAACPGPGHHEEVAG